MPSPIQQYREWKQMTMQVGCLFARYFANQRPGKPYDTVVINAASSASSIAKSVESKVKKACEDDEVEGLGCIIPGITNIQSLVDVSIFLRQNHNWTIDARIITGAGHPDLIAIRLCRPIMSSAGIEVPSEALVLGQFPHFPNTRLSPICALEIFTGVPLAADPKTGGLVDKANLAHMSTPNIPNPKTLWARSAKARLDSLGGVDDARAKAKVSFVVDRELAIQAGLIDES